MRIGILGVGLIGGSFALACKKYLRNTFIIGWGRNKNKLKKAKSKGIIDEFTLELKDLKNCDFILVSLPVKLIIEKIRELEKIISKKTIVFDAGSTKGEIYRKLKNLKITFIPCHPLGGCEKTGFENANSTLFLKKPVIITPYKKDENLRKVINLWKKIRAIPVLTSPEFHDRIVAFTSHLPHLISWAYVSTIKNFDRKTIVNFSGGSFNDFTRIAKASEILWKDIFLTNRKEILRSIKKFKKEISKFEKLIKEKKEKEILKFIKKAKNWI